MQDFNIKQGETWATGITVCQSNGTTPQDLTGATVTGAVRLQPSDAIIAKMTCTIPDAKAGMIVCELSKTDTAKIPASSSYVKSRDYYYDILLTQEDGVAVYLSSGMMHVFGGVQIG